MYDPDTPQLRKCSPLCMLISAHQQASTSPGFYTWSSGPADSYTGHETIALAFTRFIASTPTLRCRSSSSRPASPSESTADLIYHYIVRMVQGCRVPRVVSYAALYILIAISRSCSCPLPVESLEPSAYMNPTRIATSTFSHALSRAFTRSPFSKVRKSHWGVHHIFMGPFLVALRVYKELYGDLPENQGIPAWEAFSVLSGLSTHELDDLETTILSAMDEETREAVISMIYDGTFKSLRDVECVHTALRRQRLLETKRLEEVKMAKAACRGSRVKRIFGSIRRLGEQKASVVDGTASRATTSTLTLSVMFSDHSDYLS